MRLALELVRYLPHDKVMCKTIHGPIVLHRRDIRTNGEIIWFGKDERATHRSN